MGFSRLFYLLKRILYKLPKKILVYILIFIILFMLTTNSHASQIDIDNVPNADIVENYKTQITMRYYNYLYQSIKYAKQHNNEGYTDARLFYRYVTGNTGNKTVYFIADDNYMNLYAKRSDSKFPVDSQNRTLYVISSFIENRGEQENIVVPGTANTSNGSSRELEADWYSSCMVVAFNTTSQSYTTYWNCSVCIPYSFCYFYPTDIYEITYQFGNGTYSFINDNQVLQDISEKIEETNIQLQATNDFLNDDTTPTITSSDIPSIDLNDPTSDTFNRIFTRLYDATTTTNVEEVNIDLPFLDYTLTVRSDYLSSKLASLHLDVLTDFIPSVYNATMLTLIYVFWRFYIYKYIVLDVYRIINEIRNGNIDNTEENIKADML